MAAPRGNRNELMSDGLMEINQHIALLKFAPDADIQFLTGLESEILLYLQERAQVMQERMQAMVGPAAAAAPGPSPFGGGGATPSPPGGEGGGGPGFAALPPVDEMRRMVTAP